MESEHRGEQKQTIGRQRMVKSLEAAREGISLLDEDGEFVYVNDAYADTFGYDPDEMIGKQWNELGIEANPDRFHSEILPRIAEEDQWTGTTTCVRSDDSTFPARHSLTQTEDDELICVVRDITDQTEREQELARYERIVENLPVGVYRNTPGTDGDFVAGNERLASIFDANSVDELLEYNVSGLYANPDQRAEFSRQLEREGRVEGFELKQETLAGETIWISITAIRTEEDGNVYFDGIVQDVTERRKRKQKLEARSAAMEKSIDGIAILNENREYTFVNQAHAEIYGYDDPEAFIGESWRLCYNNEELDRLEAEALPAVIEEGSWRGEATGMRKDGSTFPQELSLTVLDDGRYICIVRDVTELRERERELERYETLFKESRDVNGVLAPDGTFEHLTPSTVGVLGYDPEELVGENAFDYVHPEDRERVAETFAELVENPGREPIVEYRFKHADGSWIVLESRGRNLLDEPNVEGIVVYSRDVTERKEREQNLRETREQLEVATSSGSVGVWTWDIKENVLTADEYLAETYGMDPEEAAAGAPIEAFFEPMYEEDRERVWQKLDEAVEETGEFEAEYRVQGADDDTTWVVSRAEVEYDDGEPIRMHGAISDITERKQAEQSLQESEERLRLATDAAEIGIWELDLRTNESPDRSPHHDRIFGYKEPLDDWSLETFLDHVHPDDREWVEQSFEDAFEMGEWEFECRIVRTDDEQRWITARGEFYYDEDEPVRAVGTVQDITEQKEREEYLRDAKSQLEAAAEAGAVGTWEWHIPEDRFVTGASLARKFGVDPEAARDGVPLNRLVSSIHEADRERVKAKIEEAVESCGKYEAEYRVRNADGEFRWVVARGHVESDEDGNPVTFPGALTDITERKEAQRKIEESERRYRTLVENFPNGAVGLFDEDLQYTVVGGQLLNTLGLSPEDRTGKHISEIHSEDLRAEIEPYFRAALKGDANSFEIEYHDRHLYAHTLPVRNNDEMYAGMLVVQDVTERREAQRELRESEAKFRMLAENLEEIVWMATPDAEEFIYINPAFEEVWGLDRDDLYEDPTSFLDVVHPEDRERVREGFAALPDEEFDDEFQIVHPDGEVRWVHATGSRVHDEDGEMVRVVGVGEEITERLERERELEQSERRYRTLAKNFPSGAVAVYDDDLRYTLAQGSVLGDELPARDQVEGRTVPEVYPPDIVDDLDPLLRAAVEDGETGDDRFEFGGRHWRVWATPLRDDDGEIFAGLSFAQDVTEQVERERELERVLDLLEKTERIADVGGWEIDTETQDVFWTDHIFDLLDVDADEEPPLDEALDMYHEEDKPIVVDAVDNALASGDPFDVEVRLRTAASNEVRWLRLQGVPETVDGDVVSFRGAAQDITERKQREQRLEELIDDLEASNERLEQFAYAASHDLQEPLRMVSSYLQLIEQRYGNELDEDGEEFIDFAVDGADRMRGMIEGLLKYSRVETRGDQFEPVDLDSVLADVRADLQVRIQESDAEITADSLPRIEGDEGQLRQVFQNLLDNAIEYSGDEPPQIDISAERDSDEWVITVRDEGIGIDAHDTDRVFEVFESLHTPDEHSGTGIGLALCERIVERHGGDIWVDTDPGEGSTFSFTLPADGEHSE